MTKYNTKALEEIVEILDNSKTGLIIDDIMDKIDIDKQKLYTYLNRLIKKGVVSADKHKGVIKRYSVISKDNLKRVSVLKECVLEFNRLMDYNKGNLSFPSDLNKDKIRRGVQKCL